MSIRGKIVGMWEIVDVMQIRKNSFQNPLVEVGQKLRFDPSCRPVSTVEVCRPSSTVEIQRSSDKFRVNPSETWGKSAASVTTVLQPQAAVELAKGRAPRATTLQGASAAVVRQQHLLGRIIRTL